jgi:hypothetical protein
MSVTARMCWKPYSEAHPTILAAHPAADPSPKAGKCEQAYGAMKPTQQSLRLRRSLVGLARKFSCAVLSERTTLSYLWTVRSLCRLLRTYPIRKKSPEVLRLAEYRIGRILDGEVLSVVRGLRQMKTLAGFGKEKRELLEGICGYLENNAHRMQYDKYLKAGYPIASGVIEGACRCLVKDRMERTGMALDVAS